MSWFWRPAPAPGPRSDGSGCPDIALHAGCPSAVRRRDSADSGAPSGRAQALRRARTYAGLSGEALRGRQRRALALFINEDLVAEPGRSYSYSSYGYNLLAAAVQSAAGMPFAGFVHDSILAPLWATGTAFDDVRRPVDERVSFYSCSDPAGENAPVGRELFRVLDPVEQAAKYMIVMVKIGRRTTKYVLAVVAGTARVDFGRIKALFGATYVSFARPEIAEELSGSQVGTVLPFAFDERLLLIVDDDIFRIPELFFNAARLDRSVALATSDDRRIASARIERVAAHGG